MKKLRVFGLLAAALLAGSSLPARAADQAAINRAIKKGVGWLRRRPERSVENGLLPSVQMNVAAVHDVRGKEAGALALIGLTLLECDVPADDAAVKRAAEAVRKASVTLTYTYAISLSILFLDRLGDPRDVPLIESLMVRLMAGQDSSGGWTYGCPGIDDAEQRRLTAGLDRGKDKDKDKEKGAAERGEAPKRSGKRSPKDLSEPIKAQLVRVETAAATGVNAGMEKGLSDNSNTQFAALALWVGRRHGLPVERALAQVEERFRTSQNDDGGWGYYPFSRGSVREGGPGGMFVKTGGAGSTASMTCAGVLALSIADGAALEWRNEHPTPKGKKRQLDISKDAQLKNGLVALGSVIGNPGKLNGKREGTSSGFGRGGAYVPPGIPEQARRAAQQGVVGRTYYFLWSLERVAVALDLETIAKKDWYGWGSEIILANQKADGSWFGDYGMEGADTCFALLFLKRANLAGDLTAMLRGRLGNQRTLRAANSLRDAKARGIQSGIETKETATKPTAKLPETESGRLTTDFLKASGAAQMELLDKMRSEKGVKYTEALATAIPRLEGEVKRKARDALAERLTRMKAGILAQYLEDEDTEIRRAAALACGMKPCKELIPNLIVLLRDAQTPVVRAAHAALKELTGQDFGPATGASREDCDHAALKWLTWWGKQHKKSESRP